VYEIELRFFLNCPGVSTMLNCLHGLIMICDMCAELLSRYESAANEYSQSVEDLAEGVGLDPEKEYDNALIDIARARRLAVEQTRNQYNLHVVEHGCDNRENNLQA